MNRFLLLIISFQYLHAADPLPSWNDGVPKKAILQFINDVTDAKNENFIPVDQRIATFDQDGTLWVEQPLYTQLVFVLDRFKEMAPQHPEWKDQDILSSIDEHHVKNLTEQDMEGILEKTYADITLDAFHKDVVEWLNHAVHPRFKRPYTELIYQPMMEVIELFHKHGFQTYIVSGGGQEFMRSYAQKVYGIGSEKIIGSAGKVRYDYQKGNPALITLPEILLIDNYGGKPETINLFIGKRPVAAFGNSDGDRQMLEWTKTGGEKRLALLVHHDDASREYAYGSGSKIGTFSDSLMSEANDKGWAVVSMRKDWKIIFPWQKTFHTHTE